MIDYFRYSQPEVTRTSGIIMMHEDGLSQIVDILDNVDGYVKAILPRTIGPASGSTNTHSYQKKGLFVALSKKPNPTLDDWEFQGPNVLIKVFNKKDAVTKSQIILLEKETMFDHTSEQADAILLACGEESSITAPIGSKLLMSSDMYGLHLVDYFDKEKDDFSIRLLHEKNILSWDKDD
jgi:hypothetical protein